MTTASLEARVTSALSTVMDPELDRSLVELRFATAAVDGDGRVTVELRLPTFWCASNFAYLMAADARDAVAAVPGVRAVTVRLLDHFAGEELTGAVASAAPFDQAFGEDADGSGLDALRRLFLVKAFTARQDALLRRLLAGGRTPAEVCAMRVRDLGADTPDRDAYLDRRRRLGLPVDAAARLVVRPNGAPVEHDQLEAHLRRARLTRVGMEANASLCGGLLATRYGPPPRPSPARGGRQNG
ncbi:MAG TPA: iron-sulfur cluster assembly protein [Candidatus Dormibacteraeota bacterium]|nr:iron-sulfur cluster assembly protein [Candidatus Dormibacteraeota bacterium]